MIDLSFDLAGESLPADYAIPLWEAVSGRLPWLELDKSFGILPLKGSADGRQLLLSRRSKLVFRVARDAADKAKALSGSRISVLGSTLLIGEAKARELEPHPTLHAHLVAGSQDEGDFVAEILPELESLGCKWICGIGGRLNEHIFGRSLVLHDLKPDQSILIQEKGLGDYRRYGCGIFVPCKNISGLD